MAFNLIVPKHSAPSKTVPCDVSTTSTKRPSKLARREPPLYANAKNMTLPLASLACDPLSYVSRYMFSFRVVPIF